MAEHALHFCSLARLPSRSHRHKPQKMSRIVRRVVVPRSHANLIRGRLNSHHPSAAPSSSAPPSSPPSLFLKFSNPYNKFLTLAPSPISTCSLAFPESAPKLLSSQKVGLSAAYLNRWMPRLRGSALEVRGSVRSLGQCALLVVVVEEDRNDSRYGESGVC